MQSEAKAGVVYRSPSMSDVLLLSRHDLVATLDFRSTIDALEAAFHAERRGEWNTPHRITAHAKAGGLLAMPCAGGANEALGAKLVTTFSGNPARGLPSVSGLYALFNPATGEPQAVMDGAYLTLVRTAAVSAFATRLLSRPETETLGILGAGAQAEFHVRLVATVRPIRRVVIWSRRSSQADALVRSLKECPDLGQIDEWRLAEDACEAAQCDVVVTATAATEPVLQGDWLRPGCHVNAIGAHTRTTREIDTRAVMRANTLAVETADTLAEAGDLQIAHRESGDVVDRVKSLGALADPARPHGPRDSHAISIFKSCGVAFEDLAVAALAYERARAQNLGTPFVFR